MKTTSAENELDSLGVSLYDAHGKFVGIGSVIDQLQPKLAAMSSAGQMQALQAIFGSSANRQLLDTILAGSGAFDKATTSITQHNSVQTAAARATADLHGEMERLRVDVENDSYIFGQEARARSRRRRQGVG